MKKFYLSLALSLICCVIASAATKTVNINVTGVQNISRCAIGSYSEDTWVDVSPELQEGNNTYEVETENYFIIQVKDGIILKAFDGDGYSITAYDNTVKQYVSSYSTATEYNLTVKALTEAEYRSKSVEISMEAPEKVKITRADGTNFTPEESTITIPYNPDDEKTLSISPTSSSSPIYQVLVDGVEATKSGNAYRIPLVIESENNEEPASYVSKIQINDYPENFAYKATIKLTEGTPVEMITYIKIDQAEQSSISECLGEEGFEILPGQNLAIGFNTTDYKIDAIYDNASPKSTYYAEYSVTSFDTDHTIEITGHKYKDFNVTIEVEGAEGIKASFGSTRLALKDGTEQYTFNEKNTRLTVSKANDNYEIIELSDDNGTKYNEGWNWNLYGSADITVTEGVKYTFKAQKIQRDNKLTLYINDVTKADNNLSIKFRYYDPEITAVDGYNTIYFRDEDDMFQFGGYGTYEGMKAYHNGSAIDLFSDNTQWFDIEVEDGDIVKVFMGETPAVYDVTFDDPSSCLSGYEVTQDIVTTIDPTAEVSAIGRTEFSIRPIAEAKSISVKVGENNITSDADGTFTFYTDNATTITIADTSGIDDVIIENGSAADVYNLQGIRVARQASADRINSLPAGVYIIGGKKVAVGK